MRTKKRMTIREKYCKGIEQLGGWTRDTKARTRKYIVYVKRTKSPSPSLEARLFVGKNGALRAGRTASSSRATSQRFKDKVLELADQDRSAPEQPGPELLAKRFTL